MFERGKDYERGLRPLSLILPSPARINTILEQYTGWRGAGVR
jgi:hypothetical protein